MPDPFRPRLRLYALRDSYQLLQRLQRRDLDLLTMLPASTTLVTAMSGRAPGTVYDSLRRLEALGLVTARPSPRPGSGRPALRWHRTRAGTAAMDTSKGSSDQQR